MRNVARALIGIVVGLVVFSGHAASAIAQPEGTTCPICEHTQDESPYPAKAGSTLLRGAANTLLGWTELIRQPAMEAKKGGNVLTGLGKGVGQTVWRTLGGATELLTFWTPKTKAQYLRFATDCPICMTGQ